MQQSWVIDLEYNNIGEGEISIQNSLASFYLPETMEYSAILEKRVLSGASFDY